MLGSHLRPKDHYSILCLGAHSDDIEIGCGGTLLKLQKDLPHVSVQWVVFSAAATRVDEAMASAHAFLNGAHEKSITVKDFRDGFFPYVGGEIKTYFEELKAKVSPDIVFTHYRHDRHQDHHVISDLTWNTFRDHLILEYEIPKWDGDLGVPNVFINLDHETCRQKVEYLMTHFPSQASRAWFSPDTFLSLLRLRGMESNSPSTYAEAFYGRKIVLAESGPSGVALKAGP